MSSAVLQSSSTLGTGRLSTFEERQEKAEDALLRKTMAGQAGKRKRHQDVYAVHHHEDVDIDNDNEEEDMRPRKLGKRQPADPAEEKPEDAIMVVEAPPNPPPKKEAAASAIGSALHRNADGTIASPKVRLKPPKGKLVCFTAL